MKENAKCSYPYTYMVAFMFIYEIIKKNFFPLSYVLFLLSEYSTMGINVLKVEQ